MTIVTNEHTSDWFEPVKKPEEYKAASTNPTVEYRHIVDDSGSAGYMNRIMIGTATTGLLRVEWVGARYNVTIPVNWSQVEMTHQIPTYMPLRYQVADAQNIIVREALSPTGHRDGSFEWLLLLEHDVVIQPDCFVRLNEYLQDKSVPIVSGLYFTRSRPSLPLVFRERGNGVYTDWEMGDKVYCDGVPTGLLMIHTSILQLMWDDSPEYSAMGNITRRIFDTPREMWTSPVTGNQGFKNGTSDLQWCNRIIEGDYIRRAGWNKYMDELEDERYPFLCDTNIFATHINPNGEMFP
jgi:hypothetical protein